MADGTYLSIGARMSIVVKLDVGPLKELINKCPEKGDRAVRQTAFYVQGIAAMLSPYKTGANRASIVANTSQGSRGKKGPIGIPGGSAMVAYVGPTMEYSAYLEFGTGKMAARPYMTPAAEQAPGYFASAVAKEFA